MIGVLRSKLLHEEERGPYVLMQKVVEAFGRELGRAPASASCVVYNEDVDVAERGLGSVDHRLRGARLREVGLYLLDISQLLQVFEDGVGSVGDVFQAETS